MIAAHKNSIKRTVGRLLIAASAAAVVCLGAERLAGQSNSVSRPDRVSRLMAGQIELVHFDHSRSLQPLGNGLYADTNASGPPCIDTPGEHGAGTLVQGFLESDVVRESVVSLK